MTGRLLFFEAFEPVALTIESSERGQESSRRLRELLLSHTRQASGDADANDDQTLDSHLKDLVGRLEHEWRREIEGEGGESFATALQSFQSKVNNLSCASCAEAASGGAKICDGSEQDHETASNAGHCIRQFHEMHRVAVDALVKYHREYAAWLPAASYPDVRFTTRFNATDKPHDIPVDIFVSGSTRFHDTSDSSISEVSLHFLVREFDWRSYLACLYVLFHECFCHAFQGIHPSVTGRKPVGGYDSFADGWMDWLAIRTLEDIADRHGPAGAISGRLSYLSEHVDVGRDFHLARCDYAHPRRSGDAPRVAEGAQAASRTFEFLRKFTNSRSEQRAAFATLSLDINVRAFTLLERQNFVSSLRQLLAPARIPPPGFYEVGRAFTNYLKNKDIHALVSDVDRIYKNSRDK